MSIQIPLISSSPKIGPGTGISSIMAFLQARERAMQRQQHQGRAVGAPSSLRPCLVYFGCRDSSEELYSEQMHKWLDSGVITGLHVAMSRGRGPKVSSRGVFSSCSLARAVSMSLCCAAARVSYIPPLVVAFLAENAAARILHGLQYACVRKSSGV